MKTDNMKSAPPDKNKKYANRYVVWVKTKDTHGGYTFRLVCYISSDSLKKHVESSLKKEEAEYVILSTSDQWTQNQS